MAPGMPEGILPSIDRNAAIEAKEYQPPPTAKPPVLRRAVRLVDPSISLGQIVELTTEADLLPLPDGAETTPCDRLHALIQANRSPNGQRALFAAIDALRPELKYEDYIAGLQTALSLQRERLEGALEDPTVIQARRHVREKLEAEYIALPNEEEMSAIVTDALLQAIKERVGSRWRVEAMGRIR